MTSRRDFIKTVAALPPMLGAGSGWAASDPSRLALVIGNSAYANSPLLNPTNDAKAVAGLLTEAGFNVSSHFNATRSGMFGAIEKFGTAIKRSEAKLVVFYFAGHGVQLDWRNYLLPVDAVIRQFDDVKSQCLDLSQLIGVFQAAKDRNYIVILDACRDDPFGQSRRPDQKGLSQFDAPVGSLLAYATAPGSVAVDGSGKNGLYTENLVRELSQRETRIEDALKRVRLNVRLASKGAQIPWETTSLEDDVFIFSEMHKKLSESELEKLIEADITEWERVKSSKQAEDWVGYIRKFPNGRFAEIAQMRMNRLLAASEMTMLLSPNQSSPTAKAEVSMNEKRQREIQTVQQEQTRLDLQRIEAKRIHAEQLQRLDRERETAAEAEGIAALQRRKEEQRPLAQQTAHGQEDMERRRLAQLEAERIAAERQKAEENQRQQACFCANRSSKLSNSNIYRNKKDWMWSASALPAKSGRQRCTNGRKSNASRLSDGK